MASVAPGSGVVAPPAHSAAFRKRRFLNWFPLGLAYAFLYMGRYNLNVAKNASQYAPAQTRVRLTAFHIE